MYLKLVRAEDIAEGTLQSADANGTEVLLARVAGQIHCIDGICNHGLAYLADGDLEGHEVVCPLHGGAFDVRSGAATRAPCTESVKSYPVRIEGGQVLINPGDDDE